MQITEKAECITVRSISLFINLKSDVYKKTNDRLKNNQMNLNMDWLN